MIAQYRRHRDLCSMIVPVLAFFLIFCYGPMVGLMLAFKEYSLSRGMFHSPWVGFANFTRLFGSPDFPLAVRNTVVISALRLVFGFFAPIILALLLNECRVTWFRRGIQTLTYLPYFFSWVVLGGIFLMILGGDGPLNSLIQSLGHSPISFLSNPVWFIVVLIVTGVWQGLGYAAVIYLAALAGIDGNLYEAASLDGASRWNLVRSITMPSLSPTVVVLLILSLGNVLNAGFDQIYNMYNPVVYSVSDIVDTYVLRRMIDMDFGLATAAGLFKSVVSLLLVVAANSIARRATHGEQGVW
ncbi:MAG: ABC transporter permease subunit [Fimbriimonas sp.]|nr:ABC transporter permease subunit [Fimbriimonas sp.]